MASGQDSGRPTRIGPGLVHRPAIWNSPDRHILLGISHPSDDPSRHRVFEVRASFDTTVGGWVAQIGEQDLNEQRGDWRTDPIGNQPKVFATAETCLGEAVTMLVAAVDREADARQWASETNQEQRGEHAPQRSWQEETTT